MATVNGKLMTGETKIKCGRCKEKFPVKTGIKNDGYRVTAICPYCGAPKSFIMNGGKKPAV